MAGHLQSGKKAGAARAILLIPILCASFASFADDLKVAQLDQDLRELRRQVQEQQRQIDALKARLAQPATRTPSQQSSAGSTPRSDVWIDASRWQQLRVGMSELEVIELLGPPTSMRSDNGRVLLYAIEIGSSGFLSGSVTLRDRSVVAVQKPVLK